MAGFWHDLLRLLRSTVLFLGEAIEVLEGDYRSSGATEDQSVQVRF